MVNQVVNSNSFGLAKVCSLNPIPSSDLNTRDIIKQRSKLSHSKLDHPSTQDCIYTVLYFQLKSGALFLSSVLFKWTLHDSPLCCVSFSANETIHQLLFECQSQCEENYRVCQQMWIHRLNFQGK